MCPGGVGDGEDCDAAIAAMAAADPELDPVWGLLVGGAGDDDSDAESPSQVERGEIKAAIAAPCADTRDAGARCDGGTPSTESPGLTTSRANNDASGDELERLELPTSTPATSSTAVPNRGKPISNVVDKVEVPWDRFKLPGAAVSLADRPRVTRSDVKGCDAFVLDGVLSGEECHALIEQAEGQWSFWDDSENPRVTFRNACTIEVTHERIADIIWQRVGDLVNPSLEFNDEEDARFEVDIEGTWVPYAVNPRLLLSKYVDGGHFSPHTDGTTVVDFNRRTFYSCVLFLNESPWGGHTRLYADAQMQRELVPDEQGRLTGDPALVLDAVAPKPGRMLVFYHRLMHEGVPAEEKYIIRTDILYRRTPEMCTAPEDVEAFTMYQDAQLLAEKGECAAAADLFRRAFKRSEALRKVYRM